ncbi:hypothetical protein K3163_05485 [Qipengyuania sp. 1NDW9]|uniref:hypothetical protein n=1 Tax=Qipengyuania xiapuensis TaxID=2867236 RepID=UPI001C88180F|nr:hypothetical protein [Qipengyuania xiapuensis]MBX7492654.1 hypothetical protein [Qipengyuania xiapuensis]
MTAYPVDVDRDARFLRIVGWILLAITLTAFVPTYFIPMVQGEFASDNIWMQPHTWVSFVFAALFIAQPWLVLHRNWQWHRRIGWLVGAVVLGAAITGIAVQLAVWPTVPEDDRNLLPASFRLFQVLPTLVLFFLAGVALRKRPDWHWRLMLQSAYAPVGIALRRYVDMIPGLSPDTSGPLLSLTLLFGLITFLVSDKIRHGRTHPANWLGLVFFILTVPLSLFIASTDWYARLTLGQ